MINSNIPFKVLTIRNSPVEFLLAGPKGSRNGILIRSDNLKTDLIGFAAKGRYYKKHVLHISSIFPSQTRRMYSVRSSSLRMVDYDFDTIRSHDDREFEYKFCWIGECGLKDQFVVEKDFNLFINDILKGLESADNDLVEWSIAPVVLSCLEAKLRIQRFRYLTLASIGIYSIAALVFLFITASRFSR